MRGATARFREGRPALSSMKEVTARETWGKQAASVDHAGREDFSEEVAYELALVLTMYLASMNLRPYCLHTCTYCSGHTCSGGSYVMPKVTMAYCLPISLLPEMLLKHIQSSISHTSRCPLYGSHTLGHVPSGLITQGHIPDSRGSLYAPETTEPTPTSQS